MVDRCPENYQGDRCRKGRGHASSLLLHPDPWHEGQFSRWDGKQVLPLRPPPRVHKKDLRAMSRALTRAKSPFISKPAAKALMDEVIRFGLGGRE